MNDLIIRHPNGETEGRDPRDLDPAVLNLPGPLTAIRAKCLDCSAGSPSEVRKCTATSCALWPYRMGTNPRRAGLGSQNPRLNSRFSEKSMSEAA